MSLPGVTELTRERLRDWSLPQPDADGDKDERGRILVVGGAGEMPGAAALTAIASLRAGAGKLQIATCASAAPGVKALVPEARVIALPETRGGALAAAARGRLDELGERADAVVVGPGLLESKAAARMLAAWMAGLPAIPVVIDAAALCVFDDETDALAQARCLRILTPHAGEAARTLRCTREHVEANALDTGWALARRLRAVVVLKGGTSLVIDGLHAGGDTPAVLSNRYGNVGLATSGSGDTLAGIIGGLAARGADPMQAAAWGVYLHAAAGDRLAERHGGPLGLLARELSAEVPSLMNALGTPAE